MKEEDEIFKEWYELTFEDLPDPLEYIYYRDCLEFQRYLLWYRYRELVESIKVRIYSIVSNIRKRWKK